MHTLSAKISDDYILDLIKKQRNFDKGFRLLIEKYQERLYWHIRRMVYDHEDANDVVQNCFVKIYQNIDGFKGDSKIYTWMYRIATNETITFLNKKKRRLASSIDDDDRNLANRLRADSYFDGDRATFLLKKALVQLPEKQRIVFNLRYYDEMPYNDMSEVLNTSVGALKASYHHAVKKVERFFKDAEL